MLDRSPRSGASFNTTTRQGSKALRALPWTKSTCRWTTSSSLSLDGLHPNNAAGMSVASQQLQYVILQSATCVTWLFLKHLLSQQFHVHCDSNQSEGALHRMYATVTSRSAASLRCFAHGAALPQLVANPARSAGTPGACQKRRCTVTNACFRLRRRTNESPCQGMASPQSSSVAQQADSRYSPFAYSCHCLELTVCFGMPPRVASRPAGEGSKVQAAERKACWLPARLQ